jgi:hypothetical protein
MLWRHIASLVYTCERENTTAPLEDTEKAPMIRSCPPAVTAAAAAAAGGGGLEK